MKTGEAVEWLKWLKKAHTEKWLREALDMAIEELRPRGVYECFNCLNKSVVWDSDFSFEDYGLDGEGIVHVCHCSQCGAEILYFISCGEDEEQEDESNKGSAESKDESAEQHA